MQIADTAARLVRRLRRQSTTPAAVDIDLTLLAAGPADGNDPLPAPLPPPLEDGPQDLRAANPWRTLPGVRYRI